MKVRVGLVVVLVALVLALWSASYARADNDCDKLVVDSANIFGAKLSQVEAEAQRLQSLGMDPRVRTISTFGSAGTLDAYHQNVEKACSSWRDEKGDRKNNLIVFWVSVNDRKTAIFYGKMWKDALKSNWEVPVQTDFMNPSFKVGDYAGGFIKGMQETYKLVKLYLHPPATAVSAPVVVVPTVVVNVQTESKPPSNPPDLSGLWKILGFLAVLGFLVLLYLAFKDTLAGFGRRRAAQQKARLARQSAASMIVDLPDVMRDLNLRVQVASGVLPDGYIGLLQTSIQRVQGILDRASTEYGGLGHSAGDPDRGGKTEEEYAAIAESYQGVADSLSEASQIVTDVERKLDEYDAIVAKLPDEVVSLSSRIEVVRGEISGGREAFAEISAAYAEVTWESVRGNGTEAEKRVVSATAFLESARQALGKDVKATLAAVTKAGELLDQAESYMRSIQALKANLDEAKKTAPGELEDVTGDILRAWEYIGAHDQDIEEGLEGDLKQAEGEVASARDDLDQAKPDYPGSLKKIRTSHSEADQILKDARNEVEAAERLRDKARSSMLGAKAAVSKAEEFIEDHARDVKSEAKDHLEVAQRDLREASVASDADDQIASASSAETEAEKAYKHALGDFNYAEEQRRPPQQTVVYVPYYPQSQSGGEHHTPRQEEEDSAPAPAHHHEAPQPYTPPAPSHHDDDDSGGGSSTSWGSFGGGSIGGGGGGGGGSSTGW